VNNCSDVTLFVWAGHFFSAGHQIHDGWCKDNRLYVCVGDQFYQPVSEWAGNPARDVGKILCMDFDGSNKAHVAHSIRDPYAVVNFPSSEDAFERTMAVANGSSIARIWFASIKDDGSTWDAGWTGDDTALSWSQRDDTNHPNPPNAVLQTFQNDPSPNGLAFWGSTDTIFQRTTSLPIPAARDAFRTIFFSYVPYVRYVRYRPKKISYKSDSEP